MSLNVKIVRLSGLPGRGNRLAKVTFRDHSFFTDTLYECGDVAEFDQAFEWPIASALEPMEQIHIQFYNFSKVFSNRLIGNFDMILQQLVSTGEMNITESLLDPNNTALKIMVTLELKYHAPDGTVGNWHIDEFNEPKYEVVVDTASMMSTKTKSSKHRGFFKGKERPTDNDALVIGNRNAVDVPQSNREPRIIMEDTQSVASLAVVQENVTNKRSKPEIRLESSGIRPQDFQVSITVIEARQLSGTNMDPVVMIQVGDDKKQTTRKESTNCPYYNEVFVFDYNIQKQVLFDKMVQLTVLHSRNIIRSGTLVGTFKMDVGTIYANQDHMFYHKWAVLTDPDDLNTGPKGYLKVDISVVGKGDNIKIPKTTDDDEDDIENNLLLPDGVQLERQRAMFFFRIYQAEGLPKMNNSTMEKLKTVLQGEKRDLVDPYVEISFCGQKGRTSVKHHSYEPSWNEQVTFTELFPPLCKRIRIQLRDKDNITNSVIGTAFLDLDKISNSADRGFLPTFGPTYVNLYGAPRNYTVLNEHSGLNEGLGEGVSFRGRILMALSVELVDMRASDGQGSSEVVVENITALSELGAGKIETFFLYGCFMEANMIDRALSDKQIQFEVTIGNFGNVIDGENLSRRKGGSESDGESEDERSTLIRRESSRTPTVDPSQIYSTSPVSVPITADKDRYYYHLQYQEKKPCVFITSKWHDQKRRLYNTNLLEKVASKLDEGIQDVQEMIKTEQEFPHRRLRGIFDDLSTGCSNYTRLAKSNSSGAGALGLTKLDRERGRLTTREMDSIGTEVQKLRRKIKPSTFKQTLVRAKAILRRIKFLADDLQGSVPDVFIWLLVAGKRVAYARIASRKILYSVREEESGEHCGKIQTVFLRYPGKRSIGPGGWSIQAKLEVYFWLGLATHKRDFLKGLPDGYTLERDRGPKLPPTQIVYKDKQEFELRAHLYMARNLIAADDSGLSDPYAKIIFATYTDSTQVISETLNPTWDQTLIIPNVTLYGRAEELRDDPPVIIIEIFDRDVVGNNEFIGRTMALPSVKMSGEKYEKKFPPTLDWYNVYRGGTKAGEILASFELLQVKSPVDLESVPKMDDTIMTDQGVKYTVPKGIRPILAKHRVEILFWGLRDLKRVQLVSVDRPRVDIEIAGCNMSSCVIPNYKKNPNFAEPVRFIEDVMLPEVEYWCPPISISVFDCRAFGRNVLVGTHIISNISKFFFKPNDKSDSYTGLKNPRANGQHPPHLGGGDIVISMENQTPGMTEIPLQDENAKDKGEEEEDPLDEAALDWWSKYFASLDTLNEEKAKMEIEEADTDLYGEEEDNSEQVELADTPISKSDTDGGKSGKGRRLLKGAVGAVNKAKKTLATPVKKRSNSKQQIDELKIYDQELENISQFSGFNDLLHSFDLFRGKREDDADDIVDQKRIVGTFKGAFRIYRTPLPKWVDQPDPQLGMFKGLPANDPIHVMVRVYVVRANDLHPTDPNGKADPYLVVGLGKQKTNDKENYISKQLNPMFGKTFEFEATFPMENILTVQVFDWDLLSADDLIGEVKIDLENRFYSKHRATCGIAEKYSIFSYNQWRDPMKPTQILAKLCKDNKLDPPTYTAPGKVKVGKKIYTGPMEVEDENGHKKPTDEHAALVALRNWQEIPKVGCPLVPEHVETRSLFNPEKPGIEQGRLELWVDLFPMDMPPPGPAVDISPRKPKGFQLRVIIWNTEDVVLQDDDFFTGEKASDIYVKGWLIGEDKQETDIHYRSLTGEGNFNWRFVYPFDYLVAEEKIVVKKKESLFSWDETEFKIPPRLNLQVWDADHFSADDFLGSLTLDLTRLPRGAKSAAKCSLNMAREEEDIGGSSSIPMISLFKQRRIKGWWPFTAKNDADELEITGKVEAEIVLLTADEAEKNPAGLGRDEPDPLEKPNRPDTSFVWFMNPLKSLRYLVCTRFKWLIIKLLIILILSALLVLFIYSSPSWLMKRIVGA